MKNKYIYIKNIFVVLILSIFPMTSVYAEKDPNSMLSGVYAQNEQWACNASVPPLQFGCPECWTEQTTATGRITYDGNGLARGIGRWSYTNTTNPAGDIGTYDCDWTYEVLDSLTFEYSGTCEVSGGGGTQYLTNQKWFGQIGKKGEILLVERHDIPPLNDPPEPWEGTSDDEFGDNTIDRICGKTGVQIKIQK